jgi:hypothetical protein
MQLDTASVTILNSSQSASIGKWLQKPLEEITKCDLNDAYTNMVSLLCDLERAYTFVNKTRGFPKVKMERPAQLSHWIHDGRGRGSLPIILDVPKFTKVWRDWWSALQPTWRQGEAELVRGDYDGMDWEPLYAPGANSMLGPVACLYWWGCAVLGKDGGCVKVNGDIKEWMDAVEDVTWVLDGLIEHAKAKK